MLDMRVFREKPDLVRESEKKRFKDVKNVEMVVEFDKKWRSSLQRAEKLKHKRNVVSKEIAELKKSKKPTRKKILEMKRINNEIARNDKKAEEYLSRRDLYRYKIGNILNKNVPVGKTEEENSFVRAWGEPLVFKDHIGNFKKESKGLKFKEIDFLPKSHVDLLGNLDLADTEKASKLSGARFFYLKNELVSLNLALIRFAMDFLVKEGFTPIWTPFMLRKDPMARASELSDFENQLYKIDKEDLFLIATAEQTLAAYHMNETFKESDLPKLYAGFSTNFRREAGSHGKDTKGIFRVHQFDKVEQFVFCRPEDSDEWFEKLIKNTETLHQKLSLPYRIMSISSGEMNDNASIKYDLETWMPAQGRFREVVSCSNCTDYQPRKLNVKFVNKKREKFVLHTLNATAIATGRTIVAILENYQRKDGSVSIPKVLKPYLNFGEIKR
ncbi:MAG: serine--tRNA ligase [Candidatus Aenigmarchaeota archaeon]|nr:serine--tRNA ligase [Candidatus Aenigmarchaeota archaeon]NIP40684.1 serine--tRNA ligase [Candidatus Aenigmarchaeota archaeon]NIQ18490.1 serine--tRNA ligase [Candidatus Aenigmarchaeota archaeon]NIS73389.1 serine--tRNA ligase [Candidatus Aenigmarchaeota archaeon]